VGVSHSLEKHGKQINACAHVGPRLGPSPQWRSDDFTVVLKMAELKMTPRGAGGEPSRRAVRTAPAPQLVLHLPHLVSIKARGGAQAA
jgi:hypothetical protein